MHIINATFRSIFDVSLGECLEEIGVYVLWSKHAVEKPSYLGEGDLVSRIVTHMKDDRKPFSGGGTIDGCVAILNEGTKPQRKVDAQVIEVTLLEAASRLDVYPKHNSAPGNLTAVYRRGQAHDTVRVNIGGMHPLRLGARVNGTARLSWRWDDDDGWQLVEVPWRRNSA